MALLIVLGAGGQAAASALAGPVLVHRSAGWFAALAVALVAAVLSDLAVGLLMAGLTADWSADVRRRLCRVALGQDLPTLETTPVGELLDRIDNDVYQVAAELRGTGVRLRPGGSPSCLLAIVTALRRLVAGRRRHDRADRAARACCCAARPRRIAPARMAEEEAWSDLAAVMEESIHGQDDVRTSLARPYVLRLYARRAAEVLARGRPGVAALRPGHHPRRRRGSGSASPRWCSAAPGRSPPAGSTAPGSPPIWLLALAFGGDRRAHQPAGAASCSTRSAPGRRVQLLAGSRQEPAGGAAPADGDLDRPRASPSATRPAADDRGPALRDVRL